FAAETVLLEEERRLDRPAGDDRDVTLHAHAPAALGLRLDRPQAAALNVEALSATLRVRRRACVPRARDIGQTHVQLARHRAAPVADAGADAAGRVTEDEVARPAQALGPAFDHERVVARHLLGHLRHVQLPLDAPEV